MPKYLISFPAPAMQLSATELVEAGEAARAVVRAAKQAGVYVFGGGINEDVAPVRVAMDGQATVGTYPQSRELSGGFCILELPTREEALVWAARLARACRCAQELREFHYDPES